LPVRMDGGQVREESLPEGAGGDVWRKIWEVSTEPNNI
jgi:hypothetical protein